MSSSRPATPNRERLKTRFGAVTLVSPGGSSTNRTGMNKTVMSSAPKSTKKVQKRRASGIAPTSLYPPVKSKSVNDLRKNEVVLVKENNDLRTKIARLQAELRSSILKSNQQREVLLQQSACGQERVETLEEQVDMLKRELSRSESHWQNRSSEIEFEMEEKRIAETQSFEDSTAKLRSEAHDALERLERCQSALERAGINSLTLTPLSSDREDVEQHESAVEAFKETLESLASKLDNSTSELMQLETQLNSFNLDEFMRSLTDVESHNERTEE